MPGCREKGNHEPSFHHARILLKCELPLSDFPQKTPLKNAVLVLSEVRGTGTAKFFSAEKSRFCPFRDRGAGKPLGNGGAADAEKHGDNQRQAA